MAQFQITINIDAPGVQAINRSGQYINIVKSVRQFVAAPSDQQLRQQTDRQEGSLACRSQARPVVWLAFSPQETNVVAWNGGCHIYESSAPEASGTPILINTITSAPVNGGYFYTYANNVFDPGAAIPNVSATEFRVQNDFSNNSGSGNPLLTFGLAQDASINNLALPPLPLSAAIVLNNQMAAFGTTETVAIFLSSCRTGGTPIPWLPGNACIVELTAAANDAVVAFNDNVNTFHSR